MTRIKYCRTGGFNVHLRSYSGMVHYLGTDLTREEAKSIIKLNLKIARKMGCIISKVGKGEWEIGSRDDAVMVSDTEGYLVVFPCLKPYRKILDRKVFLN